MARRVAQSDPALSISFWNTGVYTNRDPLFAQFKSYGINLVQLHDALIDGENMEVNDKLRIQRRPGFSIFCPIALADTEIVDDFSGFRNLTGEVVSLFDSTERLAQFTDTTITTVIPKTTTSQGFSTAIENILYYSDGASTDMQRWDSSEPLSSINPSPWGIPAPTLTPSIFSRGCWLPFTGEVVNNAILDPNGSVEVVTKTYGGSGITGANQPLWPTTTSSTINDGSVQWTNMGPLLTWLPATYYPVPVVVLDTNGNLELATVTTPAVLAWDASTTYAVGITVSFGGEYWTSLVSNTDVPPSSNYTVTVTSGSTSTTQPYWVQAQNPSQTGTYSSTPYAPAWNKTVGGTTTDGNYTWTNLGPGVLVESFGTSYVYCFRTIYGHLSTASPVSINTGSIFGPQVATITGFSITDNVVTFQGVNNFIPGSVFSVQGLSIGTYLNNQSFIILSAGLSPTQFSAVFDAPDTPETADSGSTLNLVATVTGVGNTSPLCSAVTAINATQIVQGIVTVYSPNVFAPGIQVTLSGLTVATFLNNLQFEIINVDPLGQWFQVLFTTDLGVIPPDQPKTTDTGIATFNSVEIYRTSDGGGIYLFTGAVTNPTGSAVVIPFDSGISTAATGTDNGVPGDFTWSNPGHVSSPSLYATVTVPTPSGSGGARFNAVQTCQNITEGQTSPFVLSASFGTNVTAGNTILIFVTTFLDSSATLTDSQGNGYTLLESQASSDGVLSSVYRAKNVAAGPTTVRLSVTPTSGKDQGFSGFAAVECSGLNGTAGPHNSVYSSGTTLNTGTITTSGPAQANSVVFSFIWSDLHTASSSPATPPGAYSLLSNQVVYDPLDGKSYQQMAVAYQVQTATGTFHPTWATPADFQGIGITASFELSIYEPSDGLNATNFQFAVPPAIMISGIEVDFDALFTGTPTFGILDVQLLRGGNPVGTVMQVLPTNSNTTYTLGGAGVLWGTTWSASDFNSTSWGVQITATQLTGGTDATFSVRNVRARLTGSTSTTGWVFNDFTTDENLDVLQIAPQNHLNDPPPGAPGSSVNQVVGTLTKYWNGRLWMVVGNYVYFNAGPDCTNGIPEQAWPPSNRFQFVGPVLNLVEMADGLGLLVVLADRVNAILGGPETISFYPSDALSNFGISSSNSVFRDGSTIGLFTTQKQYFELISSSKQEIGEHIADYLTENFDPARTYATMHRNGLDVGVFLSNGIDQVLRFGSNIGAWSVPAYPLCGAGALRSIETSVGTYSLMLASPTGGISSATPPTTPESGVSFGSGTAWVDPDNITMGSPTDYATLSLSGTASQILQASRYPLNIPENAVISGVQVAITGTGQVNTSGPSDAGLGADVAVVDGAEWVNPNDITLDTPATPANVTVNEPPTPPAPVAASVFAGVMIGTSQSFSYTPVASGNTFIVFFYLPTGLTVADITVTDNQTPTPNTYAVQGSANGTDTIVIATTTLGSANIFDFTITIGSSGGGNSMPLGTAEVSGVASLDNVAFHEGTGTTFTCPITTSGSNELILSFAAAQYTGSQTVSFTESGSWAIAQSNQGEELSITTGFAMISQSFTTPGTYTPTVDSAAVPTLSIVQKMGQTNNFFPLSETLTPTAGNSILVSVGVEPTTNSVTVTDTQSNSYSLVVSQPADGSHSGAYIFRADGVTNVSNTITVHCTSAIGGIEVYELPPLDAVDQTGASYFSSGTTPALPAVITTAPGEFCLCVGSNSSGFNFTAGSGWTLDNSGTQMGSESQVQGVAGSLIGSFTAGAAGNALVIATFPAPPSTPVDFRMVAIGLIGAGAGGPGGGTGPTSDMLVASTYGFSVPANSAILGIEADITGLQTIVSATTSVTAALTSGGTVRTFNLGTSTGTTTFGGSTDTWGLTLTPTEVNAADFGIVFQVSDSNTGEEVEFELSAAKLKIWYAPTLIVSPLNAVPGAESDAFTLGASNTTVTFGGSTDLWGMPWTSPFIVNAPTFGFGISALAQTADFAISEVQVTVFYQAPGNYLFCRDLESWGDNGTFAENNGTPYEECFITVGSIALSQPGANMFPLQHVVGYFDAVGTLNDGAPSRPDIWILPNEINASAGIGFVYLPEIIQEPPTGQNHPSATIQALRWPVNMANSQLMSQFVHHLQVKIEFQPENAPNTIKEIAFKQDQE